MEPNSDAGATDVSSATPFLSFSCSINRRSSSLLLEKDKKFSFQDKRYIFTSPQRITIQNSHSVQDCTELLHVKQNFQDNSGFLRRVLKGKFY